MDDPADVAKALGAAAIVLLRFRRGDIPPCHTRVVRERVGFPWDKQVALHPLHSNGVEMKAVEAEPDAEDRDEAPPA